MRSPAWVASAAGRLVAGIERRSWHVFAPAWVAAMFPIRAALPLLATIGGRSRVASAEAALRAAGPGSTRPVGAGGQADTAARIEASR